MSEFTTSQRRAIELRGNVLVVAGAGTGKTRTLVQRCLEWLWESPGEHSLDRVLMVTFTEAAAAEMRHRLRVEIERRVQGESPPAVWLEQLALLETAAISTLHSFCYRLVRQHFFELEIDPQVNILPAEEQHLLREETLTRLLQQHYSGTRPSSAAVRSLIEIYARGWEVPIRKLVWQLHAYAQSLPDPAEWFARERAVFASTEPSHWRSCLEREAPTWVQDARNTLETVDPESPNVARCLAALRSLPLEHGLDNLRQALEQIQMAYDSPWPHGSIKKVRDRIKDFFADAEFLRSALALVALDPDLKATLATPDDLPAAESECDGLTQDWRWSRAHMSTLLDLTEEFGREFAAAKKERGALDFQDLEQFTLRLLWDRTTGRPSALAHEWRRKFRLIFVDEYQDINAAQDAILRAVARDGAEANRFLVGDPKQSIYRFRLADPAIFQNYLSAWRMAGDATAKAEERQRQPDGQLVALKENFRSHAGILAFINLLFGALMRADLGGILYDELNWLEFGNPAGRSELAEVDPNGPAPVEFHLCLTGHSESEPEETGEAAENDESAADDLSRIEREARLVGLRLAQFRAEPALIWDAEKRRHRPVTWRDMVILVRSPRFKAEAYAKEFARLEIPLTAARGGFLDSLEIQDLLNLLRLLDNPVQDLPLLGVLRSPMAGLSTNELALIRLAARGSLWHALQAFHRCFDPSSATFTPDLRADPERASREEAQWQPILDQPDLARSAKSAWTKVDQFLKRMSDWRRFARQASIADTLSRVLDETDYEALLRPQLRGEQQRGNVAKLLSWARRFDQSHRQGLFRFLMFIEAQRDAQIDHEPAPLDSHDAVRLMSIHQSKGLEFPIVVVADLGKSFNSRELNGEIILDPEFGLCPLVKPPFSEQRFPSVAHWMAERRRRRDFLGEELRLLYVALTRASNRLVLFGTASQSKVTKWSENSARISTRELLAARSYLDWVGPQLAAPAGRPDWMANPHGQSEVLSWFTYTGSEGAGRGAPTCSFEPPSEATSPAPPRELERLTQNLKWSYPSRAASEQTAKVSISRLRTELQASSEEGSGPDVDFRVRKLAKRPPLSATELGIAHHKFLQFVSLAKVQLLEDLKIEADRLEQNGRLTQQERAALDLPAVEHFWRSPVGETVLERRPFVERELPFTFRLSMGEIRQLQGHSQEKLGTGLAEEEKGASPPGAERSPELENEVVVVTGVADLVVLLPTEIWVLDFKTDAVGPKEWEVRRALYRPQLQLYALALSRIYRRPVTRCWLHSLTLGRTSSLA